MRLLGINIPDEKRIEVSITYIYGIGPAIAKTIIKETGIDPNTRAKDITPDQANKIKEYIAKECKVEGELRQAIKTDITRLKDIGAYRGLRHARKLPARGQRTKTNSRTVRGNIRKTAGSGKRKVDLK